MNRTILATGAIVEAGPRVRWGSPGQRPMSAPVREKLVAFAAECPEVPAALRHAALALIDADPRSPVIDEIVDILKRMAGEEPPR